MRKLLTAFGFLAVFSPSLALASGNCSVPLERYIQTSPALTDQMTVIGKTDSSLTLQANDDPRIIAEFTTSMPMPSTGLSVNEYMSYYEGQVGKYAENVRNEKRDIETSFFPVEPLAWRTIEKSTLDSGEDVFQARMSIRFSETCLVDASFIGPDTPNLHAKWKNLVVNVAELRSSAQPFLLTTSFEKEDTSPKGATALFVGFVIPLVAIAVLYSALKQYSRLDPPSRNTKIVIGSIGILSLVLGLTNWHTLSNGLTVLKYTDLVALLTLCSTLSISALFLAQKAALASLVTGALTGTSLLASAFLGWTPDTLFFALFGAALLLISILGFIAWRRSSLE
jgi:hypothetical protein